MPVNSSRLWGLSSAVPERLALRVREPRKRSLLTGGTGVDDTVSTCDIPVVMATLPETDSKA